MIPLGGVKLGAFEGIEPFDVCMVGEMQPAKTADHDVGGERRAARNINRPTSVGELHIFYRGAKAKMRLEIVLLRNLFAVPPDLASTRIGMAPIRVEVKGKRVEM